MAIRHRKRSKHRLMGNRSWGRGNIKHGRGAGSRGGKGFAGSHKHKWFWILKHHPDHFGRESMRSIKGAPMKTVNLWEINRLAAEGKIPKGANGAFEVEFTGCKVLGSGNISFPVSVKAAAFSEKAVAKIKAAGGIAKPAE